MFDPEYEEEFVGTEYVVTTCHGVQIRRTNVSDRQGCTKTNMHDGSDIDERRICCGRGNGRVKQIALVSSLGETRNVWQNKHVTITLVPLLYLQSATDGKVD